MTTILITGGAGFVGSYVLRALLASHLYKIVVIIRTKTDLYRINEIKEQLTLVNIDDLSLTEIFTQYNIDGVIHLATHYSKKHCYEEIPSMLDTNILFGTQLVDLSAQNNVKFFINTGTFFEYSMMNNPICERSEKDPYNLYAATKIAMDSIVQYYAKISSTHFLTLKLATPYGYQDNQKLISFLMKSVVSNQQVDLEKGEQEWDFIYVKDVANAYVKAVEFCLKTQKPHKEDIYIGTGKAYAIKDMVKLINKFANKDLITTSKPYDQDQIFLAYGNISKAKNLLQWLPVYSLENGLKETYQYYHEGIQ
ncbi:MAG: NAD(P)-dependent oxidoreductase [Sulfuricurvum sp.]|nr:NAD(P)-dependent oxidoreductase [Sulfuricurvum sp.]MDP3023190.1 NAD(P)-dependent oxidoreductase [Sulfuricurvum sp.]